MENEVNWKKTSECIHFIAALDVFGQKGSEKGSKMAPTLIKPMENLQLSSPGNILCMEYFLYIQKGFSNGKRAFDEN